MSDPITTVPPRANALGVLLKAAVAGLGIAQQPTFIADELLQSGELREILKDYPLPELGIYAVLPGNRHIPHRLRVLIDFLVERLGANAVQA